MVWTKDVRFEFVCEKYEKMLYSSIEQQSHVNFAYLCMHILHTQSHYENSILFMHEIGNRSLFHYSSCICVYATVISEHISNA